MSILLDHYNLKMKDLDSLESVWYCEDGHLDDIFEPNYLKAAFTKKVLSLGPLIFGQEKWSALFPQFSQSHGSSTLGKDPLTQMFLSCSMYDHLSIFIILTFYRSVICTYALGLKFI